MNDVPMVVEAEVAQVQRSRATKLVARLLRADGELVADERCSPEPSHPRARRDFRERGPQTYPNVPGGRLKSAAGIPAPVVRHHALTLPIQNHEDVCILWSSCIRPPSTPLSRAAVRRGIGKGAIGRTWRGVCLRLSLREERTMNERAAVGPRITSRQCAKLVAGLAARSRISWLVATAVGGSGEE